ncbi:MAG: hypothetical protein WBX11_03555 [Thiobacillaceae bacterium]|jgi:hypothetical protein
MIDPPDQVDVDDLPDLNLALWQPGMAQYRTDLAAAEFLFANGLSHAPDSLPLYRALIKFYNRQRQCDAAHDMAVRGMNGAAGRANLPPNWRDWIPDMLTGKEVLPC